MIKRELWLSGKAEVCKTSDRRFESDQFLQKNNIKFKKLYSLALGMEPKKIITLSKEKGKTSNYRATEFTEYKEDNLLIWTPYLLSVNGIKTSRFWRMTKETWKSELDWRVSLVKSGKLICSKEIEVALCKEFNNWVN